MNFQLKGSRNLLWKLKEKIKKIETWYEKYL